MEKTLQDKLYTKYPRIFINKDKTKFESPLYYGLCCGSGWFDLIDHLCSSIQDYLDRNPEVHQVEANQVKEKFGYLNFYTSGGDSTTFEMIRDAESKSRSVCETCGSTEDVARGKGSWIKYLCINCRNEADNI